MKTKYKLSVIVPAYNAEKIIKDCLNRILQETKKIVSEIIVVDENDTNVCKSGLDYHKSDESLLNKIKKNPQKLGFYIKNIELIQILQYLFYIYNIL